MSPLHRYKAWLIGPADSMTLVSECYNYMFEGVGHLLTEFSVSQRRLICTLSVISLPVCLFLSLFILPASSITNSLHTHTLPPLSLSYFRG